MSDAGRPPTRDPTPWVLADVIAELRAASAGYGGGHRLGRAAMPSREVLYDVVRELRAALFPAHFGGGDLSGQNIDYFVGHTLDAALRRLTEQVRRGLRFGCLEAGLPFDDQDCGRRALDVMHDFARRLPAVRALLDSDVRAAFEGDPAATSVDEAIFCYPGVTAITLHRLAHELHTLDVPLIPRIISEIAHSVTGIDIHPGAQIGGAFFIDHGTGVVIGETCILGERVRLYQGVTLGARSFPLDSHGHPTKGIPRHPIVEDDVTIYAGATILGRITIGRGSTIGGNVWLTRSVPPMSRVAQAQAQADTYDAGSGI